MRRRMRRRIFYVKAGYKFTGRVFFNGYHTCRFCISCTLPIIMEDTSLTAEHGTEEGLQHEVASGIHNETSDNSHNCESKILNGLHAK